MLFDTVRNTFLHFSHIANKLRNFFKLYFEALTALVLVEHKHCTINHSTYIIHGFWAINKCKRSNVQLYQNYRGNYKNGNAYKKYYNIGEWLFVKCS